jgi:hypothetical protein
MPASNDELTEAIAQLEAWEETEGKRLAHETARLEDIRRHIVSLKAIVAGGPSDATIRTTAPLPRRVTPTSLAGRQAAGRRGTIRKTLEGKYKVKRGVQSYAEAAADFFGDREFHARTQWEEIGPHIDGYKPGDRKQREAWLRSLPKPTSPLEEVAGRPGWFRRKQTETQGAGMTE